MWRWVMSDNIFLSLSSSCVFVNTKHCTLLWNFFVFVQNKRMQWFNTNEMKLNVKQKNYKFSFRLFDLFDFLRTTVHMKMTQIFRPCGKKKRKKKQSDPMCGFVLSDLLRNLHVRTSANLQFSVTVSAWQWQFRIRMSALNCDFKTKISFTVDSIPWKWNYSPNMSNDLVERNVIRKWINNLWANVVNSNMSCVCVWRRNDQKWLSEFSEFHDSITLNKNIKLFTTFSDKMWFAYTFKLLEIRNNWFVRFVLSFSFSRRFETCEKIHSFRAHPIYNTNFASVTFTSHSIGVCAYFLCVSSA